MIAARVLRWTAFVLAVVMGVGGGLFAAGYAFEDPGGWVAVGLTAAWVVPLAGLCVLAVLRPDVAAPVLAGLIGVILVLNVADVALARFFAAAGPVGGMSLLVVGVALAFLGLKRSRLAGLLLVAAAVLQFVGAGLGRLLSAGAHGQGPGLGAVLGGSSGVLIAPVLLLGVLFFLAGSLTGESLSFRSRAVGPGM